jgi:hypothetical protein
MAACKSATPPAEENLPTAEMAATVWVALISRHLPALVHHRGPVAAGLIVFGLAKLVAAAAAMRR